MIRDFKSDTFFTFNAPRPPWRRFAPVLTLIKAAASK